MVRQIILKKRFLHKLEKILVYLEDEFGLAIAQQFAKQLDAKLLTLQQQPFIGKKSVSFDGVRSIRAGKHNRLYYKIDEDKIVVLNIYDVRINPKRNKLK